MRPSHNRHSVTVGTERSVFKFRLLRGAGHLLVDRVVVRRADQIPGRHGALVGVRLHLVQLAARQTAVRNRGRHGFHAFPANIHTVHGTRTVETGNSRRHVILLGI